MIDPCAADRFTTAAPASTVCDIVRLPEVAVSAIVPPFVFTPLILAPAPSTIPTSKVPACVNAKGLFAPVMLAETVRRGPFVTSIGAASASTPSAPAVISLPTSCRMAPSGADKATPPAPALRLSLRATLPVIDFSVMPPLAATGALTVRVPPLTRLRAPVPRRVAPRLETAFVGEPNDAWALAVVIASELAAIAPTCTMPPTVVVTDSLPPTFDAAKFKVSAFTATSAAPVVLKPTLWVPKRLTCVARSMARPAVVVEKLDPLAPVVMTPVCVIEPTVATAVSAPPRVLAPRASAFAVTAALLEPLLNSATPPAKLFACVSVIGAAPASTRVAAATLSAPVCVTAPLSERAPKSPATVPCPRFSAPVLMAVRLPVWSRPSVNAFLSVTCVRPPFSATASPKSLPACVSVMAPVPALTVVTPTTVSAPAVWLIALFVLPSVSAPPAVTLPFRFSPLLPTRLTAPPLSAPAVVKLPATLRKSIAPVPLSMASAGNVNVPAIAVNPVLGPRVGAASVNAFVSRTLTLAPPPVLRNVTAAWKSLPALASEMSAVAASVLAPVTSTLSGAAVWVMLPPSASTFSVPVVVTLPSTIALTSFKLTLEPTALTAPVKLLPA